jgi:hypothetical protein
MPQLIKKIEGQIFEEISNEVILVKSVSGQLQQEDYINMNGFVAYLQDLTRVEFTAALSVAVQFGLKNKYNIPLVTLNISY